MQTSVGQHSVAYVGSYDGEGLMWGDWYIGPEKGRWMIRFKGTKASAQNPEHIAVME
jgi:hypothetical protein